MDILLQTFWSAVWLSACPVGAWYTNRHPAVRNDAWGGALGLFFTWIGFGVAVLFCAWRGRRASHQSA